MFLHTDVPSVCLIKVFTAVSVSSYPGDDVVKDAAEIICNGEDHILLDTLAPHEVESAGATATTSTALSSVKHIYTGRRTGARLTGT